jgi:D-threo-aldose 1-dehydrogenase
MFSSRIEQRPLGDTGLTLPSIGVGWSDMGNRNRVRPPGEAPETVAAALDAGMDWFDVAPYYGLGLAERRLGDALRPVERSRCKVSTKVGRSLRPSRTVDTTQPRHGFHTPMPFEVAFDYSYDGVMRSWEASLHRLGLAEIDVLLVHDIGAYAHKDEHPFYWRQFVDGGLNALQELRAAGAIKAFGLGVNEAEVCHQVLDVAPVDCFLLAGRFTLLDHVNALPLLDRCAANGVGVIAAGPYNSGLLAGGSSRTGTLRYDYAPASQDVLDRLARLEACCGHHQVPLAAAALQFALGHPAVTSVLPGVSGAARVVDTLALDATDIPAAFWGELIEAGLMSSSARPLAR